MHVLTEDETLDAALSGKSIARFGDGELRLAVGRGCSSQRANRRLMSELRELLLKPSPALVCVPRFASTPKYRFWPKYDVAMFNDLMVLPTYGSSFITRPDNAPKIDRPDYWERMRQLWRGKDVTLVSSGKKDLRSALDREAKSVRHIPGPESDAYNEVDRLMEVIGTPSHPVIMCLGACATVLAARLAPRGVHALDLGHVGMFMRRLGV
jgi:hypothetical protein